MTKLSIVVPVYNSEKFIETTVNSLLAQQEKNAEIVLVEDGSEDGSWELCLEFADKYENIICVHTENSGPGHARNVGIETAGGEWVAFCDADDVVDETMYVKLLARAEQTNADLCVCDFFSERDNQNMGFPWEGDFFDGTDVPEIYMASMIGNVNDDVTDVPFWGSSCRGIYKKAILANPAVRFPEDITFAEDLVFNLRYVAQCRRVAVVREPLYYYTYNERSIMNGYACRHSPSMFEKRLKLVEYIESELKKIDISEQVWCRLKTTERCYYSECVGNALTRSENRSTADMLREAKEILHHKKTVEAFRDYHVSNKKKKLLYFAVKHKLLMLFFIYYRLRLFKKETIA